MSDAPAGPDSRRALLAVVCVVGLVTAATAAPALASRTPLGGLDTPPGPGDVPGFVQEIPGFGELVADAETQTRFDIGASAFGALTPGQSTDVGGAMSLEQQRDAASPHFVAVSSESQYWRTGAYTTYSGSGWNTEFVNRVQPPRPPHSRPTQWATVTLRQPASSLPAPWRPVDLDMDCGPGVSCEGEFTLSQTTDIETSQPLEPGASYRVQSIEPFGDPALLRTVPTAGTVVDSEYTSVETTDRVADLADEVTSGADNRYAAAKAVERYLESEKTYSLTDVPKPGDSIADQFLFEQSAGYCEYFATTMAVLLRTQDVPARYVVGYQGGERVGADRYLIRGADAHAWVEVYFEDVGWVRFDPTPSAARSDARDTLHENDPAFRVSLNQSAIPGDRVQANVTTAGLPAGGVTVVVNGESVGTTNAAGEVTFRVPYAEELTVEIRPGDDEPSTAEATTGAVSASAKAVSGSTSASVPQSNQVADSFDTGGVADSTLAYSVPPPEFATPESTPLDRSFAPATIQDSEDDNGTVQRFDVQSTVGFSFDGDVEPGVERTLSVTVAGKPFADAAVSVAGVEQGRTDENGEVSVQVPADASGVIDVTATRDELSETTTYPVDSLTVAVSPSLIAPLPGADATATVTAGGEPVADAVVTVAGERVGTTNEDGTLRFEMPLTRVPTVTAAASGKEAVTHVGWVLSSAILAVLVVLGALAGLATATRRRGVTLELVVATVVALANETASALVSALVGVADALDDLAAEFREAAADGWRGVLAWLASLPRRLSLADVRGLVAAAVATVVAAVRGRTVDDAADHRTDVEDSSTEPDAGRLRAIWNRFVAVVGVQRSETKTPGEVAREAVERGFPEGPVYSVTNAFRDAAYGGRPESSRLERARDALGALRPDPPSDGGDDE